jgi:hypothetical protein
VLNLVTSSQRSGESYGFAKLRATSTTRTSSETAPVEGSEKETVTADETDATDF